MSAKNAISAKIATSANTNVNVVQQSKPYIDQPTVWTALRMAMPLVATSFVFCLIGAVDMALAGWQGAAAQAAVGIADQVIFVTVLLGTGLSAATGCFVAQALGAQQHNVARLFARDGLCLAAGFGALGAAVCYLAAEPVLHFCGGTPAVKDAGLTYLQICAFGNAPFMLVLVQAAILRAFGRTPDCLRVWSLIGLISIAGAAALYLLDVSPLRHSLNALAMAWDCGALSGAIYAGLLTAPLLVKPANGKLPLDCLPPLKERIAAFARVGIPVLMSEACYIVSLFAVYEVLAQLPASETLQAAYSVTLKIEEMFGLLPLVALASMSATLTGHHVGARLFQRARALAWQVGFLAMAVMFGCGALVQAGGHDLAGLFSGSQSVASYVVIGTTGATITLPLIAFAMILFASLEGAGKTMLPFAAQFAGYILCRIPLAYFFAVTLQMGFFGIWLAVLVSRVFMAATAAVIFHRTDLRS